MIKYKIYNNNNLEEWENFISNSINATLFHSQKFLQYHIDRVFKNHSLMFYKKNKLIGLFTASETNNKMRGLFSHPGASFGGIITNNSSLSDSLEMVELIESYAKKNDFHQITIVPTPNIYHAFNDDAFIYSLKWKHYEEIERYYSSIIPINDDLDVQLKMIYKNKSRTMDYYKNIITKNNLKLEWSNSFDDFYPILKKNKSKYNSKPTHSLEELKLIYNIMPGKIKLLIVKKDDEIVGGSLVFIANAKIAIIFYNMINYKHVNLQISVIQILELIRWAQKNKFNYIDFGVSHHSETNTPLKPKMSLIKFKEEFCAFGSLRTVFNKKIQ